MSFLINLDLDQISVKLGQNLLRKFVCSFVSELAQNQNILMSVIAPMDNQRSKMCPLILKNTLAITLPHSIFRLSANYLLKCALFVKESGVFLFHFTMYTLSTTNIGYCISVPSNEPLYLPSLVPLGFLFDNFANGFCILNVWENITVYNSKPLGGWF